MRWTNFVLFFVWTLHKKKWILKILLKNTVEFSSESCVFIGFSLSTGFFYLKFIIQKGRWSKIDQNALLHIDRFWFQFSIFYFCGFRFSINAYLFSLSSYFACAIRSFGCIFFPEKVHRICFFLIAVTKIRVGRTEHMLRHCVYCGKFVRVVFFQSK